MLNLNSDKYSSVHLEFKRISPWIVNESDMEIIRKNASFIRHAYLKKKSLIKFPPPSLYNDQYDFIIDEEDTLKYLGVASKGILGSPFLSLLEHQQWDENADIKLLAERFHHPNCYHIGAGRHVLLKDVHLKGIGRNLLSVNEDYSHSWGGLLIKDALKGYISSRYVDNRTLLPSLKLYGLFMYDEHDSDGVPTVMAMRDARSFRLAQAHSESLSDREKQTIRFHLESFFKNSNPHFMLDLIIENYIHAYCVGVRHKAISPDNLLVDGRWIDTESLDINLTKQPFDEWISVNFSKGEFDFLPIQYSTFGASFPSNNFYFQDSWIHQLHLMGKYTFDIYKGLFDNLNYDFEGRFLFFIRKYFSHLNLKMWEEILITKEIFNLENDLMKLKLRGYFFDSTLTVHKLTFGASEIDSFDVMDKLTNRWEKVFWPGQKTWSEAFLLSEQIEKMCGQK